MRMYGLPSCPLLTPRQCRHLSLTNEIIIKNPLASSHTFRVAPMDRPQGSMNSCSLKTVTWVIFRVIGIIPSISIRVTAKMGRNIRIGIVGSEPLSTNTLKCEVLRRNHPISNDHEKRTSTSACDVRTGCYAGIEGKCVELYGGGRACNLALV